MTLAGKIRHWFSPHASNNFRANLLHNSSLILVLGIFLSLNLFVRLLDNTSAHILGFTSSVTVDEVVRETNATRLSAGLSTLSYNEKLADAARRKAANMLEENYWAHTSPSGKTPWVWFQAAGYNYTVAGENLAKDFASTSRMIEAWMASPTHRDNIVNPKYQEIGIAVVPGTLQGSDTVLVVQLFGSTSGGAVTAQAPAVKSTPAPTVLPAVTEVTAPVVTPEPVVPPVNEIQTPKWSEFKLEKTLSIATTALFILVLVADLVMAESKVVSRRVGKNWAHIIFINFILLAVVIVTAGKIM
ncbi:MAG: hypothetical protein ACD_40C00135G0003 [uncultured bacterium]|nr:MAG: hypothetical protein ACD_40C00135G0003 [uncultured bacterium]KKU43043.1 MAG: hypothetical protein UX59_C0031G0004 [Microgenomates group bacterium GW2011_GWA1_46_7]